MGEQKIHFKKFTFPAGNCGGEIRITIPSFSTKEEVETAAQAFQIIAERWKEIDTTPYR